MKQLFKIQMNLLFTKKEFNYILLFLLFYMFFLLYSSSFYESNNELIMFDKQYFLSYLSDSLLMIKILIVLLSSYIAMAMKKLFHLDCIFLNSKSRVVLITTRIFVMISYIVIFVVILFLMFLVIMIFLTPYTIYSFQYSGYLIDLILFGLFYGSLSITVSYLVNINYISIIVVFFYFIGSIFSPYMAIMNDLTTFEQIVGLFVNDLILFEGNVVGFIYGKMYIVTLITILFFIMEIRYNKNDIIFL